MVSPPAAEPALAARTATSPIGALLLDQGAITSALLQHALSLQRQTGGRLGDILIAEGNTNYRELYRALAEQAGLPFVDLLQHPPAAYLLMESEAELYLQLQAMPWREEAGECVVAVCDPTSKPVLHWIKTSFGDNATLCITTPYDIRKVVEAHLGQTLENHSTLTLWQRNPRASARRTFYGTQNKRLVGLGALMLALLALAPYTLLFGLLALCHCIYAVTLAFKAIVFISGLRKTPAISTMAFTTLDERTLPVYSILVPMYHEASSAPSIIRALSALDYPAAKLDIKLILEQDDLETLAALTALKPPAIFEILRVPTGSLRTKPKACNYALRFARGEYVTIFDADDVPDPQQLKKAVYAFRHAPDDVVCLQARLSYYNAQDNWLTRLFSLEYTLLFHHLLLGLSRLHMPIPLGGTSNHIALARLKQLGEWDPYNVTEDADIGIRLAASGWRTMMVDTQTQEEAPNRLMPWLKQRSRWIKGYMQTWLVHTRNHRELRKNLGLSGIIGFHCFIGLASFVYLTAPIIWVSSIAWIVMVDHFPHWLATLTALNLWLNIAMQIAMAAYGVTHYQSSRLKMLAAALCFPVYMVFHTIASYRSLRQLITNPHFWDKTTHGLARHIEN